MVHGNRDALRTLGKAAAQWAVRARLPLIIALAGALAGGGLYLGNRAIVEHFTPTSCPAGCVTNGNLSVSSDQVMQGWEKKIAVANASATVGAYYSVVLLDPFIYSTSGTVSQSRMEDELKGAYLALAAANATVASKHTGVAIQLLLANEGTSAEEGEREAVQQIENLEGPDRIAAVAGMGLSTLNTETAATALSQVSMPMFGAVTTGDQLNGDNYRGFFQIVPNVRAQVQTLVSGLRLTGQQPVALISSDQKSDIYSSNLNGDFMLALGYPPAPPLGEFSYDPATAEQQFAGYATTICTSRKSKHGGTALTVLYAGRATSLPVLVAQFQQASICAGLTVTVVTGSDANSFPASTTDVSDLPGAKVIVVYSDIESVDGKLGPDFVTGTLQPGSCLNQEYDPWEVATYNSVMAAALTVSNALSAVHSRAPSPTASPTESPAVAVLSKALDMTGSAPYAVPNGSFGFSPHGELANPAIPVYTNENGTCS
jgi:hypothetical protein